MKYFVPEDSIVRRVWGRADTVMVIFAGAAAEFSLNKAVDWLYFTGKLPADPIGRLFSTVAYARQIIFSEEAKAFEAIDRMRHIHTAVEKERGSHIPDWAYRDVLFMLIHYSMAAFELLDRQLTGVEREQLTDVFLRVGQRMGIPGLPDGFGAWQPMHHKQLQQNLAHTTLTTDLYRQYRKHLGGLRYKILMMVQHRIVPPPVASLLTLPASKMLPLWMFAYRATRYMGLDSLIRNALLPPRYRAQARQLEVRK